MRELNQLRTLFEIRTVGCPVTRDLPLGPPLLRHLGVERAVEAARFLVALKLDLERIS
jgi:hypothetical protein